MLALNSDTPSLKKCPKSSTVHCFTIKLISKRVTLNGVLPSVAVLNNLSDSAVAVLVFD